MATISALEIYPVWMSRHLSVSASMVHSPPQPRPHPTVSRRSIPPVSSPSLQSSPGSSSDQWMEGRTSARDLEGRKRWDGRPSQKSLQARRSQGQGEDNPTVTVRRAPHHRKVVEMSPQRQALYGRKQTTYRTMTATTVISSQHLEEMLSVKGVCPVRSREASTHQLDFPPSNNTFRESTKNENMKSVSSPCSALHVATKHSSQEKVYKHHGHSQQKIISPKSSQPASKLIRRSTTRNTLFADSEVPILVTKLGSLPSCTKNFTKMTADDTSKTNLSKNNVKYEERYYSITNKCDVAPAPREAITDTNYSTLDLSFSKSKEESTIFKQKHVDKLKQSLAKFPVAKYETGTTNMKILSSETATHKVVDTLLAKSADKGQTPRKSSTAQQVVQPIQGSLQKGDLKQGRRMSKHSDSFNNHSSKNYKLDFTTITKENAGNREIQAANRTRVFLNSSPKHFEPLLKESSQASAQLKSNEELETELLVTDYSPTEYTSTDLDDKKPSIESSSNVSHKKAISNCTNLKRRSSQTRFSPKSSETSSETCEVNTTRRPSNRSQSRTGLGSREGSRTTPRRRIKSAGRSYLDTPQERETRKQKQFVSVRNTPNPKKRTEHFDVPGRYRDGRSRTSYKFIKEKPSRLILSGDEKDSLTTFEATQIRAVLGLAQRQRRLLKQLRMEVSMETSDASGTESGSRLLAKMVRRAKQKTGRRGRGRR